MIDLRNLRIDPASLGAKKILVQILPSYEYKDGKKTDTITGYKYEVALAEHSLNKINIKIEGKQLIEQPTEGFVDVEFSGLEVFVYWSQGQYQVGARATGISIVGGKKS